MTAGWRAAAGIALIALGQAAAPPRFEPVQPELFAAGGNLVNAAADYDGDGDLDLIVGFNGAANRLYRNDTGRFSDIAAEAGVADARATRAAATAGRRTKRAAAKRMVRVRMRMGDAGSRGGGWERGHDYSCAA